MDVITKRKLERFLQSDEFDTLIILYTEIIEKWEKESCIADTEFNTIKKLFLREGKILGLQEFFKVIESGE